MKVILCSIFWIFLIISCDNKSQLSQVTSKKQDISVQSKTSLGKDMKNKIIQSVINGQQVCGTPYNCFKPVNLVGTKVKVLEIDIHSKTQASFATYDKDGKPVDLENNFVIQIKATKVPATISADIIKK